MGFLDKLFGFHHGRGSSGYGHHGSGHGYASTPWGELGAPPAAG